MILPQKRYQKENFIVYPLLASAKNMIKTEIVLNLNG